MKFYNKKSIERSNWQTAPAPLLKNVSRAKLWCMRQAGKRRFYFRYDQPIWRFEDRDDALLFSLRWSNLAK